MATHYPSCTIEEVEDSQPSSPEENDNSNVPEAEVQTIDEDEDDVKEERPVAPEQGFAPLEPPEDAEAITSDGGVLKKILVAGEGDLPGLHARCLVHYTCKVAATGEVVMDSRAEGESQQPMAVVAGRQASLNGRGLNLAVATMRRGEVAMVYIQDPQYGYGERGSFSFPAVPPNSRLVYEVELTASEEVADEEVDEPGNLLFEERLERAERRRLQGNQLFAEGQYRAAMAKYALGLSYMDEDFIYQLEGPYEDKCYAVKLPIHLNMAACQLKIKDYHTAIYNCTEVLKVEPNNVKAMFRRGTARHALGQTDIALTDLENAFKLAPGDQAVIKELHALKQTMREERKAQAQLFKGRFEAPTGLGKEDKGSGEASEDQATGLASESRAEGSSEESQAGGGGSEAAGARASSGDAAGSKSSRGKSEASSSGQQGSGSVKVANQRSTSQGAKQAPAGLMAALWSYVMGFVAMLLAVIGVKRPVAAK